MKSLFYFKRSVTFCVAFLLSFTGFSQYGDLHIEDRFDQVYDELYGPIYNISWSNTHANNNPAYQGSISWNKSTLYTSSATEDSIGSFRSGSLEALLRMYETTCKIKYIYEFMEQAKDIYDVRADKVGQSGSKYWFINRVSWHGRILAPFAHFVQLVKNESNLNNASIPLSHRPNFSNKATIGQFADMINQNNIDVMEFLLVTKALWRGNDECMCKIATISDNCTTLASDGKTKNVYELNMQAPFGCALIYMYLVNGNTTREYGSKAVEMARAYLTTRNGILTYTDTTTNAYKWYHDGWQERRHHLWPWNTGPWSDWYLDTEHREDIAHGSFDIDFPVLYNKYYSNITGPITGNQYFENYQLVRFKNTFSELIFHGTGNLFECSVFGNCDGPMSGVDDYSDVQMNVKCWTDLYKFDLVTGSKSNKVYNIMMDFYNSTEKFYPIDVNNYGGACIIGLAAMVQANRKKENLYCEWIPPKSLSISAETGFSISPNPATEIVTVNVDQELNKIVLTDLMGKEVLVSEKMNSFSVSGLQNGSYIVVVYYKDGSLAKETLVVNK